MPLMGFREYARHRAAAGFAGGTLGAVQTAIKAGRISFIEIDGKKQIDQARADVAWGETTNGGKAAALGVALGPAVAPSIKGAAPPPTRDPVDSEARGIADSPDEPLEQASYAAARAARERAQARMAQLELAEKEGRLVDADVAAAALEKMVSVSRNKVLALPSKIRARLPMLTGEHVAIIEGLVRESLEELASEGAG